MEHRGVDRHFERGRGEGDGDAVPARCADGLPDSGPLPPQRSPLVHPAAVPSRPPATSPAPPLPATQHQRSRPAWRFLAEPPRTRCLPRPEPQSGRAHAARCAPTYRGPYAPPQTAAYAPQSRERGAPPAFAPHDPVRLPQALCADPPNAASYPRTYQAPATGVSPSDVVGLRQQAVRRQPRPCRWIPQSSDGAASGHGPVSTVLTTGVRGVRRDMAPLRVALTACPRRPRRRVRRLLDVAPNPSPPTWSRPRPWRPGR